MKKTSYFLLFFYLFLSSISASSNPFLLLWGRTAPTGIIFAPFGYHFYDSPSEQYVFNPKPNGTINDAQYMFGFHWKSMIVGTFTNSYRDQVELLALYRQIIYYKRFNLSYIIGAMTGYRNHAKGNIGPSFVQSIITSDPGLLAALDAQFLITKKISFDIICPINFRSADFGFGYTFG